VGGLDRNKAAYFGSKTESRVASRDRARYYYYCTRRDENAARFFPYIERTLVTGVVQLTRHHIGALISEIKKKNRYLTLHTIYYNEFRFEFDISLYLKHRRSE